MKRTLVLPMALLFAAGALLFPRISAAAKADDQQPVYPAKAQTMKIDGTLQFRFTHMDAEESDDKVNSFGWVRARLRFAGNLTENLYYQMRFQGDNLPVVSRTASSKKNSSGQVTSINDNKDEGSWGFNTTFLGYHLGQFGDVEAGRFDVEATPRSNSTRQAFAERPFHTEDNKAGGQLGMRYLNDFLDERIAFSLGVYNGGGDHSDTWKGAHEGFANDNKDMMYAARIMVSPNKKFPFDTESDLKHSDWGVGFLAGWWNDKRWKDGDPTKEETHNSYGAMVAVRGKGLFWLADYTKRRIEFTGDSPDADDVVRKGWSTQVSYAVPVSKALIIEPKARFERFTTSDAVEPEDDFAWTTVGLNFFIKGFDANFNLDYVFKKEKGDVDSVDNNTFMLQANMYF